jgi:hypothetical protein
MDEDNEILPNHLFISLRHEFKATRVIGQRLSPTNIKVKCDISTLDVDTDDYAVRMEIALAKMAYFFEKVVDNSVIINGENEWAAMAFLGDNGPETSNNVMLCPEEPTDALLCELLLVKLKAITQGAFDFHSIEVESTDARGMSFLFVGGTPGESFPTAEEWLTERNWFSKAWWNRADASTLDQIPSDEDDLNTPPQWAYSLGFIAEQMVEPNSKPDTVVVRPEFRPKVIEGGKVD